VRSSRRCAARAESWATIDRHHREELGIALVVAVGVEGEVHGDGARRLAGREDGTQTRLDSEAPDRRWNARFITSGSRGRGGITLAGALDDAPDDASPTL